MRILFQLAAPAYLRMYGSTIRLLAERGHTVLLSYDDPEKRRDPAAAALEATRNVEVVPPLPSGSRRGEGLVDQLRAAADYLRYLDPRFAGAPYLRRRLDKYLRGPLRLLVRAPYRFPPARPLLRLALALERLVPSDRARERAIAAHAPDAVLVTPLIGRSDRNRRQTDTVKAARRRGIPTAGGIASWDHLTTKGVVKEVPDVVFVWNEVQARDAAELHFVPRPRIVATGAQLFDSWFERVPPRARSEFAAEVRLAAERYVLYVGSSPNIAPPAREIAFVHAWIDALRAAGPPLAELGVLVRPHPYAVEAWSEVDLAAIGGTVAPRTPPALPMTDADDALYFDSIHFSSAVDGINTSAMVEAFIQRRPVLTIRAVDFDETQAGTVHFQELLSAAGGALRQARTLDEHVAQLRSTLERPDATAAEIDAFLERFVRPRGLDVGGTAVLADAIEALAR